MKNITELLYETAAGGPSAQKQIENQYKALKNASGSDQEPNTMLQYLEEYYIFDCPAQYPRDFVNWLVKKLERKQPKWYKQYKEDSGL